MATNFEPHECVNFAQSMKIVTHENIAIRSIYLTLPILIHSLSLLLATV